MEDFKIDVRTRDVDSVLKHFGKNPTWHSWQEVLDAHCCLHNKKCSSCPLSQMQYAPAPNHRFPICNRYADRKVSSREKKAVVRLIHGVIFGRKDGKTKAVKWIKTRNRECVARKNRERFRVLRFNAR